MKKILVLFSFLLFTLCLDAQCLADRHNTSLKDGWISCNRKAGPNPDRGFSHWIMYKFDVIYGIDGLRIWNINHPENLNMGAKEIILDYSNDGEAWVEYGIIELEKGPGSSFYKGIQIPDVEDFNARYVLMTMKSNYGGSCVGFAEVRFDLDQVTTSTDDLTKEINLEVFPNPFSELVNVIITDLPPGDIQYHLINPIGQTIVRRNITHDYGDLNFSIDGTNLAEGNYLLRIVTDEGYGLEKLIVVHPN